MKYNTLIAISFVIGSGLKSSIAYGATIAMIIAIPPPSITPRPFILKESLHALSKSPAPRAEPTITDVPLPSAAKNIKNKSEMFCA